MSIKEVVTPDFGSAMDVIVTHIAVKPGDAVTTETPIVTLESDKATIDIPSTIAGVVKDIKVKVGNKISMGSVLLTVTTATEESAQTVETPHRIPEASHHTPIDVEATTTTQDTSSVHAGPGVRRLARELGVNLADIAGSGPKQRILKEDIEAHVAQSSSQQPVQAAFSLPQIDFSEFGQTEIEPLSRIKKLSGKYLQRNWMMIPHVTQFGEADMTTLEAYRVSQNETLKKRNIRLTPLAFILKAIVTTLKAFPHFNASLDPSSDHLIIKRYFHIGVAVDTADGLLVPVIRDVDQKGLLELAKALGDVSERARQKQLMPNELQGSSFSVSSLGGIGGTAFTPIINYPDVAILGISQASHKPVYQENQFVPRLMLPLSLSYDHRVIDGAEAARFMVYLTTLLADIRNLLL